MSKCRSCGATIDWVVTEAGKKIPVEGERLNISDLGIGSVIVTDSGKVIRVTEINQRGSWRGRVSHFATCPQANEWRQRTE